MDQNQDNNLFEFGNPPEQPEQPSGTPSEPLPTSEPQPVEPGVGAQIYPHPEADQPEPTPVPQPEPEPVPEPAGVWQTETGIPPVPPPPPYNPPPGPPPQPSNRKTIIWIVVAVVVILLLCCCCLLLAGVWLYNNGDRFIQNTGYILPLIRQIL